MSELAKSVLVENRFEKFKLSGEEIEYYSNLEKEIAENIDKIKGSGYVLSSVIPKGGSGKSSMARNLALVANEYGLKVCIIDVDSNSSVAVGFGEERENYEYTSYDWLTDTENELKLSQLLHRFKETNVYFMPSNRTISGFESWIKQNVSPAKQPTFLSRKLKPLQQVFDLIIFDTCPSEDDAVVDKLFLTSDFILIPTELDVDSVLAARRTVDICNDFIEEDMPVSYGVVFNKVGHLKTSMKQLDKYTDVFKNEVKLKEQQFLGKVRFSEKVTYSKNDGFTLTELEDVYSLRVMYDYKNVFNNILKQTEDK
jgi:chromosome partitioning protein